MKAYGKANSGLLKELAATLGRAMIPIIGPIYKVPES